MRTFFRLSVALAFAIAPTVLHAQTDPRCEDPAAHCSALIAPACLQRVGAGSLPATPPSPQSPAQAQACQAQMQGYVGCLSEIAEVCDPGRHADDDHDLQLPPEVLAILEDPGAGLFGGAPKVTVMMVGACSTRAAQDFSCNGAPASAQMMLSSFSPGADIFRGMTFSLFGVENGRAEMLADASSQILPVATGSLPLTIALAAAPRLLGSCMTFQRDGRLLGSVQIFGLQPGPGPRNQGFVGYQALELAAATPFDPNLTACEAALRDLARSRGL